MRVFISQPLANRDLREILNERERITAVLPTGAEIIDNIGTFEECESPLKGLGMALMQMADADMVVFAENWHFNRGCKIEHEAAYRYGITVRYASDLLS